MNIIVACIWLIALLSPALTYTYVWQLKEWRLDRMRVYCKEEGILQTLIGKVRGSIVLGYILLFLTGLITERTSAWLALIAFALLSCVQIVSKKQRWPVFTKKAKTVIAAVACFNMLYISITLLQGLQFTPISITLVVLQPFVVGLAVALIVPLDTYLKQKLVHKAITLRAALPAAQVVGITGSVGKTTTKELLHHLLQHKNALVTPEHVNSEIGVANWAIQTLGSAQSEQPLILVVEMGAYRKREIERLCAMMQPTIGIITAIGTQHIGLFGSQQNIITAKSELFVSLPSTGLAIYSKDSETTQNLHTATVAQTFTVGVQETNDCIIHDIHEHENGLSFTMYDTEFFAPIIGAHNVTNIAMAIQAAVELGVNLANIKQLLNTFGGIKQTFTLYTEHNITIVDDTHNASEASMLAAINWAKLQEYPQKTLYTSGIIELGREYKTVHNRIGIEARRVFDRIICTNNNAAKAIEQGYGKPVELLSSNSAPVSPGSLLVCEGRVSKSSINQLVQSGN